MSFAVPVLMLFEVVVFSNCAHFAEDLYHLDLISFASKLIVYTPKWSGRLIVEISHGLPYHELSVKR